MVHELMHILSFVHPAIRFGLIGIELGAMLNLLQNFLLQCVSLCVRHYGSSNLALLTVKHSHDSSFAEIVRRVFPIWRFIAETLEPQLSAFVHVLCFCADKRLI